MSNNIVLISPPSRSNWQVLPLSLISLAGWLEHNRMPVTIVDVKRSPFLTLTPQQQDSVIYDIVDETVKHKPYLVGLTCFSADYHSVIKISELIKKRIKTKIIIGGVHPIVKSEDFFFPRSPIDFVAIGEGEELILELANAIQNCTSVRNIAGLAFSEEGKLVYNSLRKPMNLEKLPMPAYNKVNMDYYLRVNRNIIRYLYISGMHILTSRGCPFSCTFCANRNIWNKQQPYAGVRYRPIEAVVDEVEFLKNKYYIDCFFIADDTFAIKEERTLEFCDMLISRNIDVIWGMETRVNLVSDRMLKSIKRAGCVQVEFGVESGSQEALDRMKKGIKVEDTIRAFDLCKRNGLRTFANIMINTPGETLEDLKKTLRLKKKIRPHRSGIGITVPFIGTDIYEQYVKPPLSKDEYVLFEHPQIFSKVLDSRFRLAAHNLNLDKLHYKVNLMNYLNTSLELTMNFRYWLSVLKSKRKKEFVPVLLGNLIKQFRSHLKFIAKLLFNKTLRSSIFGINEKKL